MVEKRFYGFENNSERKRFYDSLAEKASDENGIVFLFEFMTEKGFSEVREARAYYVSGSVILNKKNPFLNPVDIIGDRRTNERAISKLEKLTGIKLKLVGEGN